MKLSRKRKKALFWVIAILVLYIVGGVSIMTTSLSVSPLPTYGTQEQISGEVGDNDIVDTGIVATGGDELGIDEPSSGLIQFDDIEFNLDTDETLSTVPVMPANALLGPLNAAGNIKLQDKLDVVIMVDSSVQQLAVGEGDSVAVGDLLVLLDTLALERAVAKAEIDRETALLDFEKQTNSTNAEEVFLARANLLAAQEKLAKVMAGPTEEELAAAQNALAAAHAKYADLQAGPSGEKIDQARATFLKADVDRQEAQRAYDQVAWRADVGTTAEAAKLQKATIEYERTKAALDDINKPSSQEDIQSALSGIQNAQDEQNKLLNQPAAADVAEAQAKVAEAEAALAKLNNGAAEADLRAVELKYKKALIDLQAAQSNLQNAQVSTPIAGTVLELKVKLGESVKSGDVAATIGDTSQLKLTIDVAEVDIAQVYVGQNATVTLNALRGQSFAGMVEHIAPLSKSERNVVNYPVTIRLTSPDLSGIRPGMTAIATLEEPSANAGKWLVPLNALVQQNGQAFVKVVRSGGLVPVSVMPGTIQGEWINVNAADLRANDMVVGSVASFVDQQAEGMYSN